VSDYSNMSRRELHPIVMGLKAEFPYLAWREIGAKLGITEGKVRSAARWEPTSAREVADVVKSVNFEDLKGEDGRWIARDLQEPFGYDTWQRFQQAIERAMISCENSGSSRKENFLEIQSSLVSGSANVDDLSYSRQDYRLTRFAAYLVAMNGDPRKREIAEAQAYFAQREAERVESPAVDPRYSSDPLYQMITKVIDNGYQILSLKERQEATDGKVVEVSAEVQKVKQEVVELREDLAPKVKSWQHLVDDKGGIELAVAAQSFNFTPPGKKASGRTTFNEYLRQLGWLCHNEAGFVGTRPTQNAVNNGWMEAKRVWLDGPGHYTNQAFLTPKGYEKLEKIISTR
jgi:phage antirepressor YoqD-like protein